MIVVAKLKARTGKEGEVEKALKEMISKVENEEGTLTYTLHRSQNDPTEFLFYEQYRDKAAFDRHCSTPYFRDLFDAIGPSLAGEPTIEIYDKLEGIRER